MIRPSLLGLLALLCAGASAQDRIYRCGADGREYSQRPCSAGTLIDVADTRSELRQREAIQIALREAHMAATLAQERHQRERAAMRQGAANLGPVRRATPDAAPRSKAKRKPDGRRPHDDWRMTPPMKAFSRSD